MTFHFSIFLLSVASISNIVNIMTENSPFFMFKKNKDYVTNHLKHSYHRNWELGANLTTFNIHFIC